MEHVMSNIGTKLQTLLSAGNSKFYELIDYILKNVDSNPYLGVMFDKDLNWSTHIDNISKKSILPRQLSQCLLA